MAGSGTTYGGTGDDYPYAHTKATKMLSDAIDVMSNKSNGAMSLRQIAGRLHYKAAVVVSHMRTGRLAIPIDRAIDIARATEMDEAEFMVAVLEQRYPDIDFLKLLAKGISKAKGGKVDTEGVSVADVRLVRDLVDLAGKPLSELPSEHIGVIREVVTDNHPRDRWVSVNEKTVLTFLRQELPDLARDGITSDQRDNLKVKLVA